jgi:hypothetical protein
MNQSQFLLLVVDEDKRSFSVEGPMSDDRSWIDPIATAQDSGRTVRCFSVRTTLDKEAAAKSFAKQCGYELVDSQTIVRPKSTLE